MKTTWTQALALPASDNQIADRVRIAAQPVADLPRLEPGIGGPLLQKAFKAFYEPSVQDLKIIREIVSAGAAYACQAYPSIEHYRRTADRRVNVNCDATSRMLTGHSGAGKSALLAAVRRMLPTDLTLDAGPDLAPFPMVLAAHVRMYSKISAADLLVALAECAEVELDAKRSSGAVVQFLRQRLYQRSVVLVLADEMQFVARSTNASAFIAQLLATLSGFGAPLFYAANYSLGHKLKARPPEDGSRFLAEPLIMLPLLPDEAGFAGFMAGAKTIFGEALCFEVDKEAEEFHAMTGGLRRMMARLLVGGYRIAAEGRLQSKQPLSVTMEHLRAAYKSPQYAQDRAIVESCEQAALGSTANRAYVCPFELPPSEQLRLRRASESHQRAALNAAMAANMATPAERAVASVQAASKRKPSSASGGGKSSTPRQALTAENLLKGLIVRPPPSAA
jgi:energy-coupling factor transporter ATP-binding protein EcfA2